MTKVNSKNLLEFVAAFFISIGCDETEVRAFLNARRFREGIVLNLPAVCLLPANKPADSKSKQYHIHVTSKSCEFFYPLLGTIAASTPWIKQFLKISQMNIDALSGSATSSDLSIIDSSMMTKVECRQTQEKQVQLSKISDDDQKFLDLRAGLYENDILVFLKYRDSDLLFVVGVPKSFFEGEYEFESTRKTLRSQVYTSLVSKKAIPVKKAVELALEEHSSDDVIESEDPISDAIYQSMVDSAEASETDYVSEEYVETNPGGTTSHRPSTSPSLGKEAIKDNGYTCAVDGSHVTFMKPDGTRYMEVHHLIPMNRQAFFKNKLDTKANIVPLCPNCHRMLHHGRIEDMEPIIKDLIEERKDKLKLSGLDITFETLKESYI